MYIPASFRETDLGALHDLLRAHPLGLLVTHSDAGLLASPVPFLLHPDEGEFGVLRAHLARANPHWQALAGVAECLVVFQGPDGYVTPSWYPSKAATHKAVPTWNYATAHVWGKPSVFDDPAWIRRHVSDLTNQHEKPRPDPWSLEDAPADYIEAQTKAIVGIEIPISRIEGKFKMSQNRDAADRAGVVAGLSDERDPHRNLSVAQYVKHA